LLHREGVDFSAAVTLVLSAMLVAGAAAPTAGQDACIVLDDFSRAKAGEFPPDWKPRKDEGREIYRVRDEGGQRFLHAEAKGTGIQAGLETPKWDLAQYPILTWSWRPREFPRGGDERNSGSNDSALAVYVAVPYSKVRGPRAVKYVWSEKVPVGTRLESNGGLTQVRVLRSGAPASREAWVEERVNVLQEWKAAFKESDTPKVGGIAVLTDSDDTKSTAGGDYRNFRACRS
jgi:Protein of unknown function (DUF3047)